MRHIIVDLKSSNDYHGIVILGMQLRCSLTACYCFVECQHEELLCSSDALRSSRSNCMCGSLCNYWI